MKGTDGHDVWSERTSAIQEVRDRGAEVHVAELEACVEKAPRNATATREGERRIGLREKRADVD